MQFRRIRVALLLALLCLSSPLFCGETRLEWNKLIFGNGGGFEDVNSDVIMADPRIQALNISNISGDYFSKAVNVTGPYYSRDPLSKGDVFTVSDTILINNNDNTTGLVNTANVVVGDLHRAVLLLSDSTIDHRIATTTDNIEYTFKSGRLDIQPSSGGTMIGTGSGAPVMNVFNVNGVPRVGIGTSEPGTALTVSGNIKVVNGTISGEIGVFQPIDPSSEIDRFASFSASDYRTITSKEFTVDYVTHNVLIFGAASLSNIQQRPYPIAVMRLLIQEEDGAGAFIDSVAYDFVKTDSTVTFGASTIQDHFSLSSSWSGPLSAGPSGSPVKRYKVLLQIAGQGINNRGEGQAWFSGAADSPQDSMATDLIVLGLPGSELQDVVAGPNVSGQVALEEVFTPVALESGNFFTTNKVLFANGGRLADSSGSFVVAQSSRYKKFKATKLLALEHHDQDILEVIKDVQDTDLFKVGSTDTLNFNPDYTTYSWNHMNIHTTAPTLNIPSTVSISNGALIVSGNVGIGAEPSTTHALKVNGSLGFSGTYNGRYGVMQSSTLTTDFTLAGTAVQTFYSFDIDLSAQSVNHDAVIFVNVSMIAMVDMEIWFEVNGTESKRYRFSGDANDNQVFPFAIMQSLSNLPPISHTVHLKMQRVVAGHTVSIPAASQPDLYGVSVSVLAVPSG